MSILLFLYPFAWKLGSFWTSGWGPRTLSHITCLVKTYFAHTLTLIHTTHKQVDSNTHNFKIQFQSTCSQTYRDSYPNRHTATLITHLNRLTHINTRNHTPPNRGPPREGSIHEFTNDIFHFHEFTNEKRYFHEFTNDFLKFSRTQDSNYLFSS